MFLKPSKLKFWLKQFGFKPAMQDKFILTIAPVLTKAKTSSVFPKAVINLSDRIQGQSKNLLKNKNGSLQNALHQHQPCFQNK
jgi:hypothetical protein